MKLVTPISLPLLLVLLPSAAWASEKDLGWRTDPQHQLLQYRFVCSKGSETVIWGNGYPGALKLKARIRSADYDGIEDVQIEPRSTAQSDLDTLFCGTFQVTITQFLMSPPPLPPPPPVVPKPTPAADATAAVSGPVPSLLRFEPRSAPLPEITLEALTSIRVGMKASEVVQKLGAPLSTVSIPEEGRLMGSYRYNVVHDRIGLVQFENGTVTGVLAPK